MKQLSSRLIDKRLGRAEESQRTVGDICEGRQGDGGRKGGGENRGIKAITNEGVPKFENDIHIDHE